MITPVTRRQIYENVCTQMINLIEEGKWKEGERIPGEVTLAQMFNVSRNSLRTAVKVLHSSEILISKPGIGTFVSEEAIKKINNNRIISMIQDERYAKEVVEVRKILDKDTAYQAAVNCNSDDVKKLENCINQLSEAVKKGDVENVIYWGSQFHVEIVEITKNKIMISIYKSLKSNLDHDRHWYINLKGLQAVYDKYIEHDRKIIDAFRKNDGELARKLMVEHMEMRLKGIEEFKEEKSKV